MILTSFTSFAFICRSFLLFSYYSDWCGTNIVFPKPPLVFAWYNVDEGPKCACVFVCVSKINSCLFCYFLDPSRKNNIVFQLISIMQESCISLKSLLIICKGSSLYKHCNYYNLHCDRVMVKLHCHVWKPDFLSMQNASCSGIAEHI